MPSSERPAGVPAWFELPVRSLVALATVSTATVLVGATFAHLGQAGLPVDRFVRPGTWARASAALTTTAMLSMVGLFVLQRWRLEIGARERPRLAWAIPVAIVLLTVGLAFDLLASQQAVLPLMAAGQVLDVTAIGLFALALGLDARLLALRDVDGTVWVVVGLTTMVLLKLAAILQPAVPERVWLWVVLVGYPFAWATLWTVWAPVPSPPSTPRRNLNLLAVAIFLMPTPVLFGALFRGATMTSLIPVFHLIAVVAVVVTAGQLVLALVAFARGGEGVMERWMVALGLVLLIKASLPDPLPADGYQLPFFARFEFHEHQAVAGTLIVLLGGVRSWLRRRGEPLSPGLVDGARVGLLVVWAVLDMARRYAVTDALGVSGAAREIAQQAARIGSTVIVIYGLSLVPMIPQMSRILRGTSVGSARPPDAGDRSAAPGAPPVSPESPRH